MVVGRFIHFYYSFFLLYDHFLILKQKGKKRETEAPNIHKLGTIFNHLSSLCAVAILSTEEQEPRLQILTKVIELGYRLKKVLIFFFFSIINVITFLVKTDSNFNQPINNNYFR